MTNVADVKWIKITTDMFDNRKLRHLRRLPDGNNIILIWVMLLTMAGRCNANGMIFLTENIPYTSKMLADELDFEENTVKLALEALQQLNMIVMDGSFFRIAGWEKHQNIEGMERIRESKRLAQARWRAKQKALPETSTIDTTVDSTEIESNNAEEDKERDNDKERDKRSVRETTHTLFKRLAPDYVLSENLQEKMTEWFKYKTERKEPYKEQGMKALLRKVENNALAYGDQAVIGLIEESMCNGWKGIIFDRLEQQKQKPMKQSNYTDAIKSRVSEVDDW